MFIEGSRLRDWLQNRPDRLNRIEVEEIAASIESIAGEADAEDVGTSPARAHSGVRMNTP